MSKTTTTPQTINVHEGHSDYKLKEGIGYIIGYHGREIDLRKISPAMADRIARDPAHLYFTFSEERNAKELAEAKKAASDKAGK